jgi:RHS repeat-associated protein
VNLYYVHSDHLNTPRLVTDTANNIRWRWDSDAFGTTPPNQNPSGLGAFEYNLRFPGQQYDAVVGLHYNYFRDYDSATARYSQADPIGLTGGVNAYHYVFNNPLRRLDPFGLQATEDAPPGPAGTPTEPIYPSGAGKKAEEACDHEAGRAEAEKRAEDARARGDSNEYCRQKRRAYDAEIRYYAAMGIKIPKEPPPCMPFPPPRGQRRLLRRSRTIRRHRICRHLLSCRSRHVYVEIRRMVAIGPRNVRGTESVDQFGDSYRVTFQWHN